MASCALGICILVRVSQARTKLSAGHCTRIRLLEKLVLRSEWEVAARLRDEFADSSVQVATIIEDDDSRELTAKKSPRVASRGSPRSSWQAAC